MDPLTIGSLIIGGGQLLGGILGNRTNARNYRAAQRQYNTVRGYVDKNMGPASSPYANELMQFMRGMQAPGTQGVNAGQDALMQMLRRDYAAPDISAATQQFDNTDLFRALQSQDAERQAAQLAGLQGSAGSIGQRFGTAMNRNEADLRRNMANDAAVRNAGISSSSFENAQSRMLQALGLQSQDRLGFEGQRLQAAQGLDNSMSQQANMYNQLMMQGFGQAAGMQMQQQQNNTGLIGLLAGVQAPQQQNNLWPQVFGNIGGTMQNQELMRQLLAQMNRAPAGNPAGGGNGMTGAWWLN